MFIDEALDGVSEFGDGPEDAIDLPPATGPVSMVVHWRLPSQAGRLAERSGAGRPAWHDDRLRGRRPVSQAAVRAHGVVQSSARAPTGPSPAGCFIGGILGAAVLSGSVVS